MPLEWLWPAPAEDALEALYFIIDSARDERIYPELRRFAATSDIVSLYDGAAAASLADVAPYLVGLSDPEAPILDWLLREGSGRGWGVFVRTAETIAGLRRHCRTLTKVRAQDGRVLLFRFYDPLVLSRFLPTCDAEQMRAVFGPINAFLMESGGGGIDRWTQHDGVLDRAQIHMLTIR
jgi:Domain of unknown function (DUF4123)